MFKRMTALVLAITLVFSLSASYSETSLSANETEDNLMALALKDLDFIAGDQQGLRLGDQLTRAEALVLIIKLQGQLNSIAPVSNWSLPLKDVQSSDWYAPYIYYAYKNNLAVGVSKDKFAPNAPVTERQFVKMILSAIGYGIDADFKWEASEQFASRLGYKQLSMYSNPKENKAFNRGDAFSLTFETLAKIPKNKNITVIETLIEKHLVNPEEFDKPSVLGCFDSVLMSKLRKTYLVKKSGSNTPASKQVSTATPAENLAAMYTTSTLKIATTNTGSSGSPSSGSSSPSTGSTTTQPTPSPTSKKDIHFTAEWTSPNKIVIHFQDGLSKESIEQRHAVKIYYKSDSENIELPIKSTQYNASNKTLVIYVNGGNNGYLYTLELNEKLIKTQSNATVKFRNATTILFANTTFQYHDNTAEYITLNYFSDFDSDSIKDLANSKLVFKNLNLSIPITKVDIDKASKKVLLYANGIPSDAFGTLYMPKFTSDNGTNSFDNYNVPIHTTIPDYPTVKIVESNSIDCISVYFSKPMNATVTEVSNYLLYDTALAPQNQLPIQQVEYVDDSPKGVQYILRTNGMVPNRTYYLSTKNLADTRGRHIQAPGPYEFKAVYETSAVKLNLGSSTLDNKIYFNYSAPVNMASATNINNYTVVVKDSGTYPTAVRFINYDDEAKAFLMTINDLSHMLNDNAIIQIDVNSVRDTHGYLLTPTNSKLFIMNWERRTPPSFDDISYTSGSSIKLHAATNLRYNTVVNTDNYKIADKSGKPVPAKVTAVTFEPESKAVTVEFTGTLESGVTYELVIKNLKTLSGVESINPVFIPFGV